MTPRPGLTLAVLLIVLMPAARAQRNPAESNLGDAGLALAGYDPVTYFDEGGAAPRPGSAAITLDLDGVTYRFVSEEHRARFAADPQAYEPAYGGWCAFAMSKNVKYRVDPLAFRVAQGRLFLFADRDYIEVDGDWVPHERELARKADGHWKAMSGESPRQVAAGSYRSTADWNLTGPSLALEGYDPVSYFREGGGEPRKGLEEYTQRHQGVLYRFASAENRDRFRADPARFEPAYGGWCAYAMGASGDKVEVNPEAFRITGGRLNLFYTSWFSDTREDWDEDTESLQRKADANWARLAEQARGS